MKILKRSITVALLLFVGATVGLLIAQEVSHTDSVPGSETPDSAVAQTGEADAPEAVPAVSVTDVGAESGDAAKEGPVTSNAEGGSREASTPGEADTASVIASEPGSRCVVDAIYFHNTLRCYTCRHIEDTAKAVVEREFPEEFASGRLRWSAINMERQQQYVERFGLVMPTLILVRSVGEEQAAWMALDETWRLIRYESRFADYVETETRTFLEVCP